MKDLKVIFMGTPEFCVPILKALIENCNIQNSTVKLEVYDIKDTDINNCVFRRKLHLKLLITIAFNSIISFNSF